MTTIKSNYLMIISDSRIQTFNVVYPVSRPGAGVISFLVFAELSLVGRLTG